MRLKTGQFTKAVGETYTIVRNVYGRPGREPRHLDDFSDQDAKYRTFAWADAVAWRCTRDLAALGLDWDDAAAIVRDEYVADWALKQSKDAAGKFLAVWHSAVITDPDVEPGEIQPAAWKGTPAEIAEWIAIDSEADTGADTVFSGIANIRMVSLHKVIATARMLALKAGYRPEGSEFVTLEESE